MSEVNDSVLEIVRQGARAEMASEFFGDFLSKRKEKIVVEMNNMVRSGDTNSVAFMCRAHVLTEISDMISALDRAMKRGRNKDEEK